MASRALSLRPTVSGNTLCARGTGSECFFGAFRSSSTKLACVLRQVSAPLRALVFALPSFLDYFADINRRDSAPKKVLQEVWQASTSGTCLLENLWTDTR